MKQSATLIAAAIAVVVTLPVGAQMMLHDDGMGGGRRSMINLVSPADSPIQIRRGVLMIGQYMSSMGSTMMRAPVPGGDSTKELYDFGEHILRRGMAVFAFDGPGQGLVSTKLKLRPDFEVPIRTVTDFVLKRSDVDGKRLAIGGISYGGLFACRAAAFDDRFKAVVSASSWYTPAGRFPSMDPLSQTGLRQYMGEDAQGVQDSITMAGAAERLKVPLLQIYGGLDKASPPEHAYRVEKEVKGPTTTLVFDDGVHVCNNLHHIVRPLIADWLADRLL